MKKWIALLLAAALLLSCAGALAEAEREGVYVLMNIPYVLFYEAETTGGEYDSVSSATRVRPLKMTDSGGSFHYMPDGREITGVIFPVYCADETLLEAYGGEEITDASSLTITVKEKGKNVKTTYTGRDALFQAFPFSYYRLSEIPAVYKELLDMDSHFGPMQGPVVEVDGDVHLTSDPHAEICLAVDGVDGTLGDLQVSAAVLAAGDEARAGVKHVENLWAKTFFGFNRDSEIFELLNGKTLTKVEFYTLEAKYVVSAGEGIPIE